MRKLVNHVTGLLIASGVLVIMTACGQPQAEQSAPVEDMTTRGKYLVSISGCNDCHTPWKMGESGMPEPDMSRFLSGHPEDAPYPTWAPAEMQRNVLALASPTFTGWAGPWGVSFSSNLTPDNETGLGEWTEEAFIQALRTGKHQGQPNGRDILPPMPWQNLVNLKDEDMKAIWAFMRSIPAVKNQVPLPVPPPGM